MELNKGVLSATRFFLDLADFRRAQGKQYELGYVLHFAVLAVLSGADSYRKIAVFIESKLKDYKEAFKLDWEKAPSYSTIRNIIQGVSSIELEATFRKHAESLSSDSLIEKEPVGLSFDGKVIRGSFDHFKDQSAIQFLSIFCSNNDLILAHEEIGCKTNEIPVAQQIIKDLNKENVLYTCDALSCQAKTLEAAKSTRSDLIVQVKNNQKYLLNKCIAIAESNPCIDVNKEPYAKERGRIESRTAHVFTPKELNEKWSNIATVIKIDRERMVLNTKKKIWEDKGEVSYYVSTAKYSAKRANEVIRAHWGIENKNHHVRDVAMKEDASRIRINPQNFARLRSFALNIMRYNKVKNIQLALYSNALNFGVLLKYKGLGKS